MRKKVLAIGVLTIMLVSLVIPTVFAAYTNITLEEAEDNVCTINLGEEGKVTKKLLEVDSKNKEATLQISITNSNTVAKEVVPTEIFLVIDNSDSMEYEVTTGVTRRQSVFTAAKDLAESLIEAQSNTKVGVVSFSSGTFTPGNTQEFNANLGSIETDAKLVIAATNNVANIKSAIDNIETNGPLTDMQSGLQLALNNLRTSTDKSRYIILLSDGVPNVAINGPRQVYSGETAVKTKQVLNTIVEQDINIITVMTGVDDNYKPSNQNVADASAEGGYRQATDSELKTFKQLVEEIFGTQEDPEYGKFYYVTDNEVAETITEDVFADIEYKEADKENALTDITLIDYFPEDIIANYDFEIVQKENIGTVTTKVDTTNNSITWTIEKLDAGKTATFQYKLKLKEDFDEKIIDEVMPTNKKVDVAYKDTAKEEQTKTSDVSPKIVVRGEKEAEPTPEKKEDKTTITTKELPKAGDIVAFIALAIIVGVIAVIVYLYKYKKI